VGGHTLLKFGHQIMYKMLVFVGGQWKDVPCHTTSLMTHDKAMWATAMEKASQLGISTQVAKQFADAIVFVSKYPETKWDTSFQKQLEAFRDHEGTA
jgi:hypothetical protein